MRLPFRSLGQAGFTPVEALLATAVGLIAISAFASFNTAQMYNMRDQGQQADLQGVARSIVDLFAREVRREGTGINVACTATASTGIVWAGSWTVRFKADLNGNGNTSSSSEVNEDVSYWLDYNHNQVLRTDNNRTSTPDVLWQGSSSITGSQILFYDSNGNPLVGAGGGLLSATQLTQIARIKLELALSGGSSQPGNSSVLAAKDAATVDLRNRYFSMTVCGPAVQTNPLTFYR